MSDNIISDCSKVEKKYKKVKCENKKYAWFY